MKNTIDDADYIINWIVFIIINQHVTNSYHSHSIVSGPFLRFIINNLLICVAGNTMKNTMLRNFLKWTHFFHNSVSTQCLIRTLFHEDTQVDDVGQARVAKKLLLKSHSGTSIMNTWESSHCRRWKPSGKRTRSIRMPRSQHWLGTVMPCMPTGTHLPR